MNQMVGGGQGRKLRHVGSELLRDAQQDTSQAVGHQDLGYRSKVSIRGRKLGVTGIWMAFRATERG